MPPPTHHVQDVVRPIHFAVNAVQDGVICSSSQTEANYHETVLLGSAREDVKLKRVLQTFPHG